MVAKDEREDSRVVYFVDTLFDIKDVHDDKRMCCRRHMGRKYIDNCTLMCNNDEYIIIS